MWGVQMNPHESINQPLLNAFCDHNRAKRLSQHTIDIQGQQMRLFDKNVNKPFQDITRTDIERFLEHVNTCYAERSVNHMKMVLKKFFKWFSEKQLGTEIEKIQKDMFLCAGGGIGAPKYR